MNEKTGDSKYPDVLDGLGEGNIITTGGRTIQVVDGVYYLDGKKATSSELGQMGHLIGELSVKATRIKNRRKKGKT